MSRHRTRTFWAAIAAIAAVAPPASATYSILARDPETGQIGAAVQSHWFCVKNVIWVEPSVGAVASQSLSDYAYGPAGLELLRLGRSAEKALEGLLETDEAPWYRQVAILDADGAIAAHTGEKCITHAGHLVGEHYSVHANLMASEGVPQAMARAFEGAQGDLAERLMRALEAAQAAGGDVRGQQSAAMLVAGPQKTGRPWADYVFDLRVDDHAEPVKELRRILEVSRAYDAMNEGDLAIERGDLPAAESAYGRAAELAPGNAEVLFWHGISLANAGEVERALEVLARSYAIFPAFREVPERLVEPGLLEGGVELAARLRDAAPRP
jgi:uncharacterized Ntn-hydrolase superfamily protein